MAGIDFDAFARPMMQGFIYNKKKKDEYEQQLQMANALSRLGVNELGQITPVQEGEGKGKDGKGKVVPIVDPKALDMFQKGAAMHSAEHTGALKAITRMGMGQLDVLRKSQAATGTSPFLTDEAGRRYIVSPNGTIKPDTQVVRDEYGRTAVQQDQSQLRRATKQQQAAAAQSKGFDTALKGLGFTSRNDLFDTGLQQQGKIDEQGQFIHFAPGKEKDFVQENPTHVRIGFSAPDPKDKKSKGRAGVVVARGDLEAYQDQAASLAGPDAFKALQWLRANPDSKLAEPVAKKFRELLAKSSSQTVPIPGAPEITVEGGDTDEEE